ncbi:hypothetical protein E2C01_044387 [Portunus trituberculatus]|uniref:Uncharacterized protein n=1 Tax=Portunus trituberculatus TaxID=210409 RepID=A0A5B7G0B3_PORTR|nr:hypothetical protein [Portunus trituberculatus]
MSVDKDEWTMFIALLDQFPESSWSAHHNVRSTMQQPLLLLGCHSPHYHSYCDVCVAQNSTQVALYLKDI